MNEQQAGKSQRRKLSWRGRFILLAMSLLVSFLLVEILLRLVGFSAPVTSRADFHAGWGKLPDISFRFDKEGESIVRTNQYGFRDDLWQLTKPENTLRIAVLGDSYTDALQVAEEKRFSEVLETQLQQKRFSEKEVEVLNFGVSGYGTAQELLVLRHRVWEFDPDIVLLAFLTGNDIRNNQRELEDNPSKPYFYIKDDKLLFDDSFRHTSDFKGGDLKTLARMTANHCRVLQLMIEARHAWHSYKKNQARTEAVGEEVGLDTGIYDAPSNQKYQDAWEITERLLATMNDEVTARNKDFVVVTLSNAIQVDPTGKTEEYCQIHGLEDLYYPDRRISQCGEENGFPVLNLSIPMKTLADSSGTYFHGFPNTRFGSGHWNENGHETAGRLISDWLMDMQHQ